MGNILVIDIGTSSMRGVLYNEDGCILIKSQIKYNPDYLENGRVEQSPSDWENGLVNIMLYISRKAALAEQDISAVALTSQRSSVIPVDKDGRPLYNSIMWQDKRTYSICEELKSMDRKVYFLTGSKVNPIFSAPKMTWIKRNLPDVYYKTYKFVTIHDYVLYLLTGRYVTDHSIASRSLLFNINTLQWDERLLKLFDVDGAKLCSLEDPGAVCGYITKEMSGRSGLKQGIPVITAGGDQQCAALGLNVVSRDTIEVNTGTGSYIIACSDRPRFDGQMRIVCNVSAIPGKYILEAGIPTTGTIYRWFNENFYPDCAGKKDSFQMIDSDLQEAPLGSNGLILLPHFQGRGAPDFNPLAKGMFFNITLGTKRSDFVRAILEGIASEIDENIQVIQEITGDIETVSAAGGLTKSDIFNQIQADMCNKKVLCYENEEASSLGAWMSAAKTTGLFSTYEGAFTKATEGTDVKTYGSNAKNASKYNQMKRKRKALYNALVSSELYSVLEDC